MLRCAGPFQNRVGTSHYEWSNIWMIRIQNIPVDAGDGEGDLWRCGYKLMTESAWNEGIQLDNKRLAQYLICRRWSVGREAAGSIKGGWKTATYFPKASWNRVKRKWQRGCSRSRLRHIDEEAMIGNWLLLQVCKMPLDHRPPNSSFEITVVVASLDIVPDDLLFHFK